MAVEYTVPENYENVGNLNKPSGSYTDAEFGAYDRARSSDAHVILDYNNQIQPIGYFDKFDSKSKTEIIYRQPIGSKVPIGEQKPGGWDLSFSNGMIDDRMWGIMDTYHKQRFIGEATPRISVVQRIKFTVPAANLASKKTTTIFLFVQTVIGSYSLNDPGDGQPLEETCTGYARFRTIGASS